MRRTLAIIRHAFHSIQARLLGSFLLSAIIAIGLVIIVNQSIQRQLIAEANTSLLSAASGIATALDGFNQRNLQSFEMAASLPIFEAYILADEEERSAAQTETLATLRSLQIQPWNQFYALSFAILDVDGVNILDTIPANMGSREGGTTYFRESFRNGIPAVSNVSFDPVYGNISLYYIAPIRRSVEPTPIVGMLRIQLAISTIQHIVFEEARAIDPNLDVTLFDNNLVRMADTRDGQYLFRSIAPLTRAQIERLQRMNALPPIAPEAVIVSLPQLAEALQQASGPGVLDASDNPGDSNPQRLAVFPLETMPWYLVVSKTFDQFYQPIERQTQWTVALSITLMIVAITGSLMISRSVTVPISELTTVARKVAGGDLSAKAHVYSSDEIGELATTFNQMTEELTHIKAYLEHLVDERTQSLVAANEALKHEIAERQRFEKQALDLALEQERARILAEFIQDASHEFKTPLSIINVKTHLIRRLYPDNGLAPHVSEIVHQSRQIERIVNNMVLMARLDSGVKIDSMPTRIDRLLETFSASLTHIFEQSEVTLKRDLNCENLVVNVHPDLLNEALYCLLDNARRFSHAGGEVVIETRKQAQTIEIRVRDNGVGIPADELPRIFERFYRADEAHTTRGFGLGLPIARRIIERLHGTIHIESVVNHGTTATICLPLEAQESR